MAVFIGSISRAKKGRVTKKIKKTNKKRSMSQKLGAIVDWETPNIDTENYHVELVKPSIKNAYKLIGWRVVRERRYNQSRWVLLVHWIPKTRPQSSDANAIGFVIRSEKDNISINRILRKLGIPKSMKLP